MAAEDLPGAIVGHERQMAVLRQAMDNDAVAPAWLFHGPAGVGKMTAAFEFARALLCAEGPGACLTCPSCRSVAGGTHPDLKVILPEAKTAKARKTVKIEQVRDLQEFLALKPGLGERRVCLIDGADTMRIEAVNAMLKTLEEPPAGTAIVLVTSNPGRLPPTIHSRCRSISFGSLKEEEVREVLVRLDWPHEEAAEGARAADGCPGAVHALKGEAWKEAGRAASLLGDAAESGRDVFGTVEGYSGSREDAGLVLRLLMAEVRQELRRRIAGGNPGKQPRPPVGDLSLEDLTAQLENLMAADRMLEGNVNVKLALGALCRRWAEGLSVGGIRSMQREW